MRPLTVGKQRVSSARDGTGNDCWRTPESVLRRVRELAPIALDPCTSPDNPVGAEAWMTEADNGLVGDWREAAGGYGLVYVNAPYSAMRLWAPKIAVEARAGCAMIALVAARVDTAWWRQLWDVADVVGFWRGRLKFVIGGKPSDDSAPFPSAVLGFNVGHRRFRSAFGNACNIVVPT